MPTRIKSPNIVGGYYQGLQQGQQIQEGREDRNFLRESRENLRTDRATAETTRQQEATDKLNLNSLDFSAPLEGQADILNKLPAEMKIKVTEFYGVTPPEQRKRVQDLKNTANEYIRNVYPQVKDAGSYQKMRQQMPAFFAKSGANEQEINNIMGNVAPEYDPDTVEIEWRAAGGAQNELASFTLSPGQKRFGGEGNLLAEIAAKPPEDKYRTYQEGGETVTVDVYGQEVARGPKWDPTKGGGSKMNQMKVKAWERIYAKEASDADLALTGLDKDPYVSNAAQMVNNDLKMINATAEEKAVQTMNLAEQLRATAESRTRFQGGNQDPLGLR